MSKIASKCTLGPQIHALDSILPTVNIESGFKGFFHSMWGSTFKAVSVPVTKSTF